MLEFLIPFTQSARRRSSRFIITFLTVLLGSCTKPEAVIRPVIGVASLSDLRKINTRSLSSGTQAIAAGFYNPGDSGGGTFIFFTSDHRPDDNGCVIAPENGRGRWERITTSISNVRWFGAKGNGCSDDHTAFNQALAFLRNRKGGTLYIPAGTYLIRDHVAVDFSNLHITGDGIGASTIKVGAWVDGIRVSSREYPRTSNVISNVTIDNLSIDGNRTAYRNGPTDTYGNGINLVSVDNFFIRNVHVYNFAEQGIVCTFFGPAGHSIQSHGCVTECIVDEDSPRRTIAIGFEGHFSHCIVSNNRISSKVGGIGIYFGNLGEAGNENSDCICTGNIILSNAIDNGVGIRAEQCWHALDLSGNVIRGFAVGIRADNGAGSDTSGATITGNHVHGFGEYGIITVPALSRLRRTTVVGNTFVARRGSKAAALIAAGTLFSANQIVIPRQGSPAVIGETGSIDKCNAIIIDPNAE